MSENLIEAKKLVTQLSGKNGTVTAVNSALFHIKEGETPGIVGESDCGKSVTSISILGLIPPQPGKIASRETLFKGKDLTKLNQEEIHQICGNGIVMISQDSVTRLNPVMIIGKRLVGTMTVYSKMDKKQARKYAEEMLMEMGTSSLAQRPKEYPHQLPGGIRRHVTITMALSCNASLFIADEPTTTLDVTIQTQILELMRELREKDDKSIMLITHDVGVVTEVTDEVMVMYTGKGVGYGDVKGIFKHPLHPYTQGLLKFIPRPGQNSAERLFNIPESVPDLSEMPKGCWFCTQCAQAQNKCHERELGLHDIGGQKIRYWEYASERGWGHEIE